MALKVGISGIRGTIGGSYEDNLTPQRIVEYTMGFGEYIKGQYSASEFKVIVGRDGRTSGENNFENSLCYTSKHGHKRR